MTDIDSGGVAVTVPDRLPVLGRRGLRALLRILVAEAEAEWGPDWRRHLADRAAAGAEQ